VTLATPLSEKFFGDLFGLPLGTLLSNFKSVALTIFELLAFNAKNLGGHVTMATLPFGEILGVMSGLSLGTRVSNLMPVALTVLKLLTFNAEKFRGSRDYGHAPFGKFFGGHVRTVPGNTCVKFEVRSFNRY